MWGILSKLESDYSRALYCEIEPSLQFLDCRPGGYKWRYLFINPEILMLRWSPRSSKDASALFRSQREEVSTFPRILLVQWMRSRMCKRYATTCNWRVRSEIEPRSTIYMVRSSDSEPPFFYLISIFVSVWMLAVNCQLVNFSILDSDAELVNSEMMIISWFYLPIECV